MNRSQVKDEHVHLPFAFVRLRIFKYTEKTSKQKSRTISRKLIYYLQYLQIQKLRFYNNMILRSFFQNNLKH